MNETSKYEKYKYTNIGYSIMFPYLYASNQAYKTYIVISRQILT